MIMARMVMVRIAVGVQVSTCQSTIMYRLVTNPMQLPGSLDPCQAQGVPGHLKLYL